WALDKNLKESNKNYAVAQSKALKGVLVHTVPEACFHDWHAHGKQRGGQVKMERMMNEERFLEWESFVKNWLSEKEKLKTASPR
nr:hypothetical protein [Sunxiuqinia sp.]